MYLFFETSICRRHLLCLSCRVHINSDFEISFEVPLILIFLKDNSFWPRTQYNFQNKYNKIALRFLWNIMSVLHSYFVMQLVCMLPFKLPLVKQFYILWKNAKVKKNVRWYLVLENWNVVCDKFLSELWSVWSNQA